MSKASGGRQVEIKQRRNSNRIGYAFGEDELQYSIEDGSGSRSFSVAYGDISRDRQTLEERNQWLGNVGLLWLALGAVLTAVNWFGDEPFVPSLWLWVGAGCYAVYRLRSTRFKWRSVGIRASRIWCYPAGGYSNNATWRGPS